MGLISGILTFLVFIFNFLLFLVALFSVYKGFFDEYPIQSAKIVTEDDGTYSVISKVILALSIFIGILAFTGCYGVATDNKLYLLVYSTTLLLLIAIQIFLAFSIYDKFESVEGDIGDIFTKIVKDQTIKENSSHHFMNEIQRKYDCCGFDSSEDWFKVLPYIPGSCCGKASNEHCEKSEVSGKPGCGPIIRKRTEELQKPITNFLFIVFGIEVFLAASTICIVISNE